MNKPRIVLSALLTGLTFWLWGFNANAGPSAEFIADGKLAPCPSTPNCVSSQAVNAARRVNALVIRGDLATQHQSLLAILKTLPRTEIKAQNSDYIWVTFTTLIMRYVDDVEFIFVEGQPVAVRSASRVGHSDLGTNRRRVEKIRRALSDNERSLDLNNN